MSDEEDYWKRTDSWRWVDGCDSYSWWRAFFVFHPKYKASRYDGDE